MINKMLCLMVAAVFLLGCSSAKPGQTVSPKAENPDQLKKCRNLGELEGKYSVVVIRHGCKKEGLTLVYIIDKNIKENPEKAKIEAVVMITKILGFRPKLAHLATTVIKGRFIFILAVVGVEEKRYH